MARRAYLYAAVAAVGISLVFASVFFLQSGSSFGAQSSTTTTSSASRSTTSLHPSDAVVVIEGAGDDAQYIPQVVTVVIGVNSTVIWVNSGSIAHTVTSTTQTPSGALFDSGNMKPGAEFSYKFLKPGTYGYYCIYHGTMVGTVVVLAQSPSPAA